MVKEKIDNKAITNETNLGALLREYREIAGYSLAQMAEALCLSDEILENLENEEFQNLPEPPYVRGYLRNYAKLADTDSTDIINAYESLRGADPSDLDYHFKAKPTILTDSQRRMSPVMGQLLLLSLLLAFIAGISMIPAVNKWITNTWNSFSDQTHQQENPNNQDLMSSMPIPTLLTGDEKSSTSTENNSSDSSSENSSQKTNENEANKNNTQTDEKSTKPENTSQQESPQTNAQITEANKSTSENVSDKIHIKLIFNMEVWMKIKDGTNKTVFEGLNAAGGSKDLDLVKPLHFRVGNAQGLSLFVDDQAVDISSYIKGSVAKFTLE